MTSHHNLQNTNILRRLFVWYKNCFVWYKLVIKTKSKQKKKWIFYIMFANFSDTLNEVPWPFISDSHVLANLVNVHLWKTIYSLQSSSFSVLVCHKVTECFSVTMISALQNVTVLLSFPQHIFMCVCVCGKREVDICSRQFCYTHTHTHTYTHRCTHTNLPAHRKSCDQSRKQLTAE